MELSSPLAAMKPPPAVPFGCRRQAGSHAFGPSSFNFRDLSMKKSQPDYFMLKACPIRGSSPTASLAADLSQNFHIDQSPQLPTPRRSLFTSGLLGVSSDREGATTPPARWEGGTTTPVPSSSPGFGSDPMDVSPLPHKVPYSIAQAVKEQAAVTVDSVDEDMISPCDPTPNPLVERPVNTQVQVQIPERKKSAFLRPSLSRTKCFSTTTVAQRVSVGENQVPTFRFGAGGNGQVGNATISSLDECFTVSPPQDRTGFSLPLAANPRPRQSSIHSENKNRAYGSPINTATKKPLGPFPRPRKQFRRSLSMYEHPEDVMKQDAKDYSPSGLQSIMDVDDTHVLQLPHFIPTDEPGSLPRINHATLVSVLNGDYAHLYDKARLVDCRFEYEYNGGHIEGAENYNDKEKLARELFEPAPSDNTLLILHCEFSKQRAPLMAQHVRKADRAYNAARYPKLTYPEVYILDGGYSSFFKMHRCRCFPQNYVEMDSADNELACERGMHKVKQRAKLSRARTYAFGQSNCHTQMQDSPSRPSESSFVSLDAASGRLATRRMASY